MLERFRQNHQEQNTSAGSWDALAAQADAGGFNAEAAMAEREKANHENQTNKIVQILRTGDYRILGQREQVTATDFEKDAVIEQIADGTIGYDQEEKLLSMIAAPSDRKGINGVAQDIIQNSHERKILSYMIGENGERFDSTYVRGFMDRFPTPLDFEGSKSNFLKMIKDHNPDAKYQEYVRDMDKFCRDMYGKRQEYYERLQELNMAASERNMRGGEPGANAAEAMEIERNPFNDMGGMITPKSWLMGEGSNKPSEDGAYFDNNGVMAIFDGVGSSANGAAASTACVNALPSLMQQVDFSNPMGRERLTRLLHDEVSNGDSTTCVVTKTEKNSDGTSMMHYVALGDSRLYVIRNNKAYQITHDDNVTEEMLDRGNVTDPKLRKQFLQHGISKQLGGHYGRPSDGNNGSIKLYPGDKIMICSDGITGDLSEDKMDAEDYAMGKRPDVMTNEEIARIIGGANGCQDAAAQLSQRAKKIDDRSVLVAEV